MKKFIALGAALMVLLSGFAANTSVAVAENKRIQVCSDLPLAPFPFD